MENSLSIFSFEGFLLDYPVHREEISEWLKDPDCLSYPLVPDLPGPSYWDEFAVSIIKSCNQEKLHDICIFSEIEGDEKDLKKRISFLLKTLGIDSKAIFVNSNSEDLEKFYIKNVNFYFSKFENISKKYKEVNVYLNDFELTSMVGDLIVNNFSLTAYLHDV